MLNHLDKTDICLPLLVCPYELGGENMFVSFLGPSKLFVVHVCEYRGEGHMPHNRHLRSFLPVIFMSIIHTRTYEQFIHKIIFHFVISLKLMI